MNGGRTNQSHETIFAPGEAEGNSGNARVPFVTRMSAFVTDREPPGTVMLKTGEEQPRLGPLLSEGSMKVSLMIALPVALFLTELTTLAQAQTAADSAAIRATALDYIEGWYSNNAVRMERALHPNLAKRMVWTDSTRKSRLVDLTAEELVDGTKSHPPVPAAERRKDVQILDVFGNAAVVRIDAQNWVDYLQQIKWNGSWKIINVVWENRPEVGRAGGQTGRRGDGETGRRAGGEQ